MGGTGHIEQVAKRFGKTIGKEESPAIRKILGCAMSDAEAEFLLSLPAAPADLATKFGLTELEVGDKLLGLARRGLVVSSKRGPRIPGDLATLHDNIMASAPDMIPVGIDAYWRELYDGEEWGTFLGHSLSSFPMVPLRTIPVLGSEPAGGELAEFESIEAIIRANAELISIRQCCCRNAAKKCGHPKDVCMQFGRRAEYDLYRGSGRKVSAQEAIDIARRAGDSGLVPTVTNVSNMKAMEFICFCCGCCCLVIEPGLRTGKLDKILAPSRFVAEVHDCDSCEICIEYCRVNAIQMQSVDGGKKTAVIDRALCLGCGACVRSCPGPGFMSLAPVRLLDFIPEKFEGPSVLGGAPMGAGSGAG